MARIYLVRHASTRIEPEVVSARWQLSPRGVAEAYTLAAVACEWGLRAVYTSVEPKATATALILGDAAALPVRSVEGLEEQRWEGWIENADEFNDAVRSALEAPDVRTHGSESAGDAASRFSAALDLVREGPSPAAVVSHARVMTAYLAPVLTLEDPYSFWRALPMAGYALLELTAYRGARMIRPFVAVQPP
jgi:broad specificity phosphatase PhoE